MSIDQVPTLVITGTIGSGKTSVATDIGELLEERGSAAAIIDLDWLGWMARPQDQNAGIDELILANLAAVWPNFRAAGAEYFVLARVIQSSLQLDGIRKAIPEADLTIVRVVGPPDLVANRLRRRDAGKILEGHLKETVEFDSLLNEAAVEDHRVVNDARPLRDVSLEVLKLVGW
jgi:nucleoside-triphosphatase THEP1